MPSLSLDEILCSTCVAEFRRTGVIDVFPELNAFCAACAQLKKSRAVLEEIARGNESSNP